MICVPVFALRAEIENWYLKRLYLYYVTLSSMHSKYIYIILPFSRGCTGTPNITWQINHNSCCSLLLTRDRFAVRHYGEDLPVQ